MATQSRLAVIGDKREGRLTAVDRIHTRASNEQGLQLISFVDAVQTQTHVEQYRKGVFAAIDQMWESVPGIIVTSQALQCTPNARHGGKKAE